MSLLTRVARSAMSLRFVGDFVLPHSLTIPLKVKRFFPSISTILYGKYDERSSLSADAFFPCLAISAGSAPIESYSGHRRIRNTIPTYLTLGFDISKISFPC